MSIPGFSDNADGQGTQPRRSVNASLNTNVVKTILSSLRSASAAPTRRGCLPSGAAVSLH